MAKLAILSLDNQDIQTDARVQRQIYSLAKYHQIHLITYGNDRLVNLPYVSMKIVGSLGDDATSRRFNTLWWLGLGKLFPDFAYHRWYWNRPGHQAALDSLLELRPDLVIANDWWTLPVAAEACLKTGARLILDLHEYAPGEFEHQSWWRFFYKPVVRHFFEKYLKNVNASVTVNSVIAERYRQEYGLDPIVVMNIPRAAERVKPNLTNPERINLIHHGGAFRDRKLELMIDVIAATDSRYHLNFMLIGDPGYIHDLKQYALQKAPTRVTFLDPVEPDQVVKTLSQFDVGIYLTPAASFQLLSMTPNKFFDYIAASLAICFGPYPVMKALIEKYHCGFVSESFSPLEMANNLTHLSIADIDRMKNNAFLAGGELNSDTEMEKLIQLVDETLA